MNYSKKMELYRQEKWPLPQKLHTILMQGLQPKNSEENCKNLENFFEKMQKNGENLLQEMQKIEDEKKEKIIEEMHKNEDEIKEEDDGVNFLQEMHKNEDEMKEKDDGQNILQEMQKNKDEMQEEDDDEKNYDQMKKENSMFLEKIGVNLSKQEIIELQQRWKETLRFQEKQIKANLKERQEILENKQVELEEKEKKFEQKKQKRDNQKRDNQKRDNQKISTDRLKKVSKMIKEMTQKGEECQNLLKQQNQLINTIKQQNKEKAKVQYEMGFKGQHTSQMLKFYKENWLQPNTLIFQNRQPLSINNGQFTIIMNQLLLIYSNSKETIKSICSKIIMLATDNIRIYSFEEDQKLRLHLFLSFICNLKELKLTEYLQNSEIGQEIPHLLAIGTQDKFSVNLEAATSMFFNLIENQNSTFLQAYVDYVQLCSQNKLNKSKEAIKESALKALRELKGQNTIRLVRYPKQQEYGVTLNGTILINTLLLQTQREGEFDADGERKVRNAFVLVTLIHQAAHHVLRYSGTVLNFDNSFVQDSNLETKFRSENQQLKTKKLRPESGFHIEKMLFGSTITRLTSAHWDAFQEILETSKFESGQKEVEKLLLEIHENKSNLPSVKMGPGPKGEQPSSYLDLGTSRHSCTGGHYIFHNIQQY